MTDPVTSPIAPDTTAPFVSCLCVTHDRVPLLQRAVTCFLAQTHWPRELLVVHEARDQATARYLAALNEPLVRGLEVPTSPRTSLGARRNIGIAQARGTHIAVWDDDDWYAPNRLAMQLQVLKLSGLPACTLRQELVWDGITRQVWLSQARHWENSLLAQRDRLPPYADLDRGEDVPAVASLAAQGLLAWMDAPQLYVYTYHGRNVGPRSHFRRNIFESSTLLSPKFAERVGALLGSPVGMAAIGATELSEAIPNGLSHR